jgi:hypothetical protein
VNIQAALFRRAKAIFDSIRLPQELKLLPQTFMDNGYSERHIIRAVPREPPQRKEESAVMVPLPFVSATFHRISTALCGHNIKTAGLPPGKLSCFLRPIKGDPVLKMPGVYNIPCECGKVYIGQTGRLIETRVKKHRRHICPYHQENSAAAEHSINLGHRIRLQNTVILGKMMTHMDRIR